MGPQLSTAVCSEKKVEDRLLQTVVFNGALQTEEEQSSHFPCSLITVPQTLQGLSEGQDFHVDGQFFMLEIVI